MQIVTDLPQREWGEFLLSLGGFQLFQSPEMFRVLQRTRGCSPSLVAALEEGKIRAILVSYLLDQGPSGLKTLTTRSVIQGGPVGNPACYGRLLEAHDKVARRAALYAEIRNLRPPNDHTPMINAGYSWQDHLNYIVDLTQGETAVFSAMSKSRRRTISGADGVELELVRPTGEGLEIIYQLLAETYRRARVPLADRTLFEHAFQELLPAGHLWATGATWKGTLCAIRLTLRWEGSLYDWYAGSSDLGRSHHADEWLVWQILREGIREHCETFDFGGAGSPGEGYGPGEFKRRFGGSVSNPGRFARVFHPTALRLAKAGYSVWRRLR